MTASVTTTVRTVGMGTTIRAIEEIMVRTTDLRPVWPDVIRLFQEIVAKAFATEGSSTQAGEWPPLAPATQEARHALGYEPAHPILQRSGTLYRALVLGEGASIVGDPQRVRYVLGPNVSYFVYHQSRAPRTKLPRRAPISLTPGDRQQLVEPIRLFLTRQDTNTPFGVGARPNPPEPGELG